MRIRCKSNSAVSPILFPNEPTEVEFIGEKVASAKYDESDTLRLKTVDQYVPVRIIPLRDIISIDDIPFNYTPTPKDMIFKIQGSRGDIYTVKIKEHGNTCNCPGFRFNRHCKHIAEALNK